jgi:uncharacterized protein YfiM (DUF2279 family)
VKFAVVLVFGSFQFGGPPERQDTRADDRWLARDKALHFAVSAAIQSSAHTMLRATGADYRGASMGAGALTITAGVAKELWDRADGRFFSMKDLTADVLGGGSAAVLVRQVDR